MCNAKIITDKFEANVTLGGLLIKLQQNMVFKNLVDEFCKRGLLDLRNESLHVHVDKEKFINFEKLIVICYIIKYNWEKWERKGEIWKK